MAAAPVRLVTLLAALALGLSACGQATEDSAGDFQGAQKDVAQTVEDLQSASRKKDASKICDELLAPALVAQIKTASKDTCPNALDDALGDADSFELQVKKVTIEGTQATVVVESDVGADEHKSDTIELTKDNGSWKIATLGRAT
jgi:Domain of unknown function (DUF4878)